LLILDIIYYYFTYYEILLVVIYYVNYKNYNTIFVNYDEILFCYFIKSHLL